MEFQSLESAMSDHGLYDIDGHASESHSKRPPNPYEDPFGDMGDEYSQVTNFIPDIKENNERSRF